MARANGVRQSLGLLWERTWFTPARPHCLEVGRIILGLAALRRMLWLNPWADDGGLLQLLRLPEGLYTPTSALRLLSLPMPGEAVAKAAWCAAVASGLLVVVGHKSRWAAASLAVFAGYLMMLENSFVKVNHGYHVVYAMMVVLAFSKSGNALSVDAWLARKRGCPAPSESWEYEWPWRAWQACFGLMLFFAASSKLLKGPVWVLSDNLRNTILMRQFGTSDPDPTPLALWVVAEPWRWQLAAAAAVLTQLSFILIVFVRDLRLRFVMLTFALGFTQGLRYMMHLPNPQLEMLLLVLVDWNRIAEAWARRSAPSPSVDKAATT